MSKQVYNIVSKININYVYYNDKIISDIRGNGIDD